MTREDALSKLDVHERMRRLDERARAHGLFVTRHQDRRSIVVTPVPPFTPEPGAHARVLLLDEVLEHGAPMFDYLEATDRMRAAMAAGERRERTQAPAKARPLPVWIWGPAAVVLVSAGGGILWMLLEQWARQP